MVASEAGDGSNRKARHPRFHGRVADSGRPCEHPDCEEEGEFRAPRHANNTGRDAVGGEARWRWLCLDHVRAFNAGYNYFEGMSPGEIEAAQSIYAGWERETRAFAHQGASVDPAWARFTDPADIMNARFAAERPRASNGRALSHEDRSALRVLGLSFDVRLSDIRRRYTELVRSYHPDRNGGDRSKEGKLQDVIAAYTHLKRAPAFA